MSSVTEATRKQTPSSTIPPTFINLILSLFVTSFPHPSLPQRSPAGCASTCQTGREISFTLNTIPSGWILPTTNSRSTSAVSMATPATPSPPTGKITTDNRSGEVLACMSVAFSLFFVREFLSFDELVFLFSKEKCSNYINFFSDSFPH